MAKGELKVILVLFVLVLFLLPTITLGQVSSHQTYTVRETWTFTNHGPSWLSKLDLWIALIQNLPPYQTVLSSTISPDNFLNISDRFGNRYAKFQWENVPPERCIKVTLEYHVQVNKVEFSLLACKPAPLPQGARRFLTPERYIESDAPEIKALAKSLVQGANSPCKALQAIYNYVAEHVRYSGYAPEARGALWALKHGEGDCTEFACLMVALCRAADIPARFVEGITNVSGIEKHDWAEVYLTGVGWVPVDPTWGRSPKFRDAYFARMSADHIIVTRGINLCLPTMHFCNTFNYWYDEYWWEGGKPQISATSNWKWLTESFNSTP